MVFSCGDDGDPVSSSTLDCDSVDMGVLELAINVWKVGVRDRSLGTSYY